MFNRFRAAKLTVVTAGLLALLGGCSKNDTKPVAAVDQGKAATPRSSILSPAPANRDAVESRLMRYSGQTKFLNFKQEQMFARASMASPVGGAEGAKSGTVRDIQESDIFKIGKKEDKVVFLLNDYRGLQIVSYAKGIEAPEVYGRVPATGNYSDNMYYAAAENRIYVLERYYYDPNDDFYSARNSRVLIYDVADLKKPRLVNTVELTGEIADSSLATDTTTKKSVLYFALSQWPTFWNNGGNQKATGVIASYRLEDLESEKPKAISEVALSLPVSQRENMNIVTVPAGDGTNKYYLVAVLSESGWGWWDRKNTVEVVDITSSQGEIKPVMAVNAKGFITEKSQTFVKNNTLLVVSNYTPDAPGAKARVAVETFKFPEKGTKGISEPLAQERALHIQNELVGITDPTAKEEKYKELITDAKLGLKGVFVNVTPQTATQNFGAPVAQSGTRLLKKVADSMNTQGDTHGLDAQLKDVRVTDTRLYAFWVPVNNIDPLDVYDFTKPEEGITHLGHTEDIEGWVDRGYPVTYKGGEYIVGLGWKVIGENNETNKRVPQGVLFKVTTTANPKKPVKIENLDSTTFGKDGNLYVDFNSADKMIDYRFDAEKGTGTILFQVSSWGKGSVGSGGKLVGFDLNGADTGTVFTEGATLASSEGASYDWLRRVFRNPDLEIINTFSDKALGTFKIEGIGPAGEVARAINVLELARNIRSYVTLGNKGVQIIDDSAGYWTQKTGRVLLRLVDTDKADAEVTTVKTGQIIPGTYANHAILADGTLVIVTSERKTPEAKPNETPEAFDEYTASAVTLKGEILEVRGSDKWTVPVTYRRGPVFFAARMSSPFWWGSPSVSVIQTKSGSVLALTGAKAQLLSVGPEKVVTTEVVTAACAPKDVPVSIFPVDRDLYASYSVEEKDKTKANVTYEANYITPAALNGASIKCGIPANIPGEIVAVLDGNLVTDDNRLEDLTPYTVQHDKKKETYYRPVLKPVLAALKLTTAGAASTATLFDLYDPTGVNAEEMKKVGNGLVFIDVDRGSANARYTEPMFSKLTLNATTLRFEKVTKSLLLSSNMRNVTLGSVVADTKKGAGEYLGVVLGGRRAAVIGFSDKDLRPIQKRLEVVNGDSSKETPSDFALIQSPWTLTSDSSPDAIHFSPGQRTFEFSQGLNGVTQVHLLD